MNYDHFDAGFEAASDGKPQNPRKSADWKAGWNRGLKANGHLIGSGVKICKRCGRNYTRQRGFAFGACGPCTGVLGSQFMGWNSAR